jgi:hypothetical protein
LDVAVSKRLSLEQFQFVVDAFQRAGRDRVVVPGQQTLPVFVESPGHLLQDTDFGLFRSPAPGGQPAFGRNLPAGVST